MLSRGKNSVKYQYAMNNTEKKEKPDLLKQMSSVVSHEIRNPLAIISNSLYFIKTKLAAGGAALDPKISKHIGIIEGEVKHSNEVIEEMLAFTRERELQRAPLSVGGIVEEAAAVCKAAPNVAVKVAADPGDPKADVDKDAVSYALRQVLLNAAQAMPEGGEVAVACSNDGALLAVAVTDSGPGFAGGDCGKPFEPFYTTKPRGIGLGLNVARKFIELHGGSVKAENVPGGGARVTVYLPVLK